MIDKTATIGNDASSRMTHAERTDLSDTLMFEAAVKLIVERGTEKTTLKDVGEMAGYSRGLAGYRFGSKSGLLSYVIKRVGDSWSQELRQVTQGKTGFEAIAASIDAHYRFCVDAPVTRRAFYLLWFDAAGTTSEVRESMLKIHERRQQDVEQWVKDGINDGSVRADVDPEAVARLFLATVIGILYQWLMQPEAMDAVEQLHNNLKQTMYVLLRDTTSQHKLGEINA